MSRIHPRQKSHVLYLGEISQPPRWLPAAAYPTIQPILENSRVGVFTVENPTDDEVRHLDRIARESNGITYVFKAGGSEFCAFIGSREVICTGSFPGEEKECITCEDFAGAVENYAFDRFTLSLRSGRLLLGDRTKVMGILNVTPDSFSDGGNFYRFDAAVARGEKMAEEGADIIDVGGESTRPGADPITLEEEARRVIPVVEYLAKRIRIPISVDTFKAEMAQRALDAGAQIINDVSALRFDPKMAKVVARAQCPLILMHMLGIPKSMQDDPHYDALIPEVIGFLCLRIQDALQNGVSIEQIIIDPGVGFGKTVEHNLELLNGLSQLKALGRPILVGPSRKSTIGQVLGAGIEERVEGTAAAVAVAIMNGANIVRVHDVKEMVRVAKMTDAILRGNTAVK
jgi:dihydropteroate synthase